jgi:hypothetical protein
MERNWKKAQTYCRGCNRWKTDTHHRDCPRGKSGSLVFIDLNNFEFGCNKCNRTWPLEDDTFYCSCGHVQKTLYTDSTVALEFGDQVIANDGNMIYVLKRSGVVVVGRRNYLDQSYSLPIGSYISGLGSKKWDYCAKSDDCNCGLPKVCLKDKCNCSRPKYCVTPGCNCSRRKGCTNLDCGCGLPKIYT